LTGKGEERYPPLAMRIAQRIPPET
jgi:hypothetical protein